MTLSETKQHIEQVARGPENIAAAVKGVDGKALRYKPAPDKWCILEILAHLADAEVVFGHRIRQCLAETDSTICPMNQDAWAANLGYMDASAEESLAAFRAARAANVRLMRRLKEADLEKSAYHPERKRKVTVGEIIGYMQAHDPNHLGQIERLKAAAK
jgi:uncharacterized damage-inducible protein DinB